MIYVLVGLLAVRIGFCGGSGKERQVRGGADHRRAALRPPPEEVRARGSGAQAGLRPSREACLRRDGEENREPRCRQDKMISDVQESREGTREAIQRPSGLAELLRRFAIALAAAPRHPEPPQTGAVEAAQNGDEDITEPSTWQTVGEREHQKKNTEHSEGRDPRKAIGSEVRRTV
ncbi:hypothetical protein AB0O22_39235 [Streptomyces sp. NPDC091204]|uniref:hypothetical protein n=1 Tax=Streptomyces sp. NPDC091204 TaxID=3155299 RepID=UPI00341ADC64